MSGRVERYGCVADAQLLAIADALCGYITQPVLHDGQGAMGGQIVFVAETRMIGVAMCDERTLYRAPWINVEGASCAVYSAVRKAENRRIAHR